MLSYCFEIQTRCIFLCISIKKRVSVSKNHLKSELLKVHYDFKNVSSSKDIDEHLSILQNKLEEAVKSLPNCKNESLEALLSHSLPIIHHRLDADSQYLSLTLVCDAQEHFSLNDFLYDLFRFHLIPGQNNYPSGFHHLTFNISHYEKQLYIAHILVLIKSERQYDLIESNLSYLLQVLERGLKNPLYAQGVLNRQITIPDQKGNFIYNHLIKAIRKHPYYSDLILNESSLFMILSSEVFRHHRPSRNLARIICSLAVLRKLTRESQKLSDSKPRINFRLIPMKLKFTFGEKRTLGLCIAVSHLGDYQLFNDGCILQAIKTYYPDAQVVKGSYLSYQHPQDETRTVYIELEKKKGEPFSLEQINYLKRHLSRSLEASVEEVVPSIFMISNEEEIMKNIIILRNELESIDDLTQVMIFFEGQTLSHLTFLIVLVRILEQNNFSISEKIQDVGDKWEFVPERTRIVSQENDEVTKEAHVFRLRLKKSRAFVRTDSSVNLHQARQHVVDFLKEKIGPIRDYTGSLIDLQNTLFRQFKEKYRDISCRYPDILEDFFYTISPADVKITLPLSSIETLFEHLMELIEITPDSVEKYVVKKSETEDFAFALLRIKTNVIEQLDKRIKFNEELYPSLISNKVHFRGYTFIGYIYRCEDEHKRMTFFQQLNALIFSCIQEEQANQTLRLGTQTFPTSLDPRITLYPTTNYIFKLLFDGLMRINSEGEPVCAVAESYTLSADKRSYTFHLRETYWNNGDPVTAHDFVYSWKKVLSPTFHTPHAYLFYSIKNAREAKNGIVPIDSVGVYAKDPSTLVVELNYPVPHFLQFVALSVFYPVNRSVDGLHPDWPFRTSQEYVCNGPFTLEKVSFGLELQLVKNPLYWDQQHVRLGTVEITFNNIDAIYRLYQKGEIHWLGAPFTPWENRFLDCEGEKRTLSSSALNWIILNTESGPLKNKKLRQALRYALNLEELVSELPIAAKPAHSPLPPIYSTFEPANNKGDPKRARELLKEAFEEMNLSGKEKPKLILSHGVSKFEVRDKLLLKMKEQVQESLGMDLQIEVLPWDLADQKILKGNFQLFVVSWKFLGHSPFFLLDILEASNQPRYYKWSNEHYSDVVCLARQEEDPKRQMEFISQAEEILLDEVPIIPLYYEEECYIKNDRLKGVVTDNRIGAVDFKSTYFKSVKPDIGQFVKWL